MTRISKIIILTAAIAAVAYGGNRLRECRIVGVPPKATAAPAGNEGARSAQAPDTNGAPSPQSDLVYPNPTAATQLKLGYDVFTRQNDGAINVLPLPPGYAMQTTCLLHVTADQQWKAAMLDPRCESDLHLNAYDIGHSTPLWQGVLRASGASGDLAFDLSGTAGSGLALMTIEIDASAKNNRFCNALISGV